MKLQLFRYSILCLETCSQRNIKETTRLDKLLYCRHIKKSQICIDLLTGKQRNQAFSVWLLQGLYSLLFPPAFFNQ